MKAALITAAAVAALVLGGANAFAQETEIAKDPATEAPGAGDKGSTSPVGKPASGSNTTVLSTSTTAPESTSTASLPKAIQEASPRKVFGEFYTETYMPISEFERGNGQPKLDSYGGAKFDLGGGNSASIRQNFSYKSATGEGVGDFHMEDTQFNITKGKLAEFRDGTTLTLQGRLYLPTGETSRANGQNAKERLYLIANKSVGKIDLTLALLGQLWQQSRDYNIVTKADGTTDYAQLNSFGMSTEFNLFYNLDPKWALGAILGMDNYAKRPAPGKSTSTDSIYLQPVVQFAPVKGLTLQALLSNELDIRNPTQEQRLFRGSQTSVSFNLAAAL